MNIMETNLDPKKNSILCENSNSAFYICQSKLCKNSAFVCQNEQCKCKDKHQLCLKIKIADLEKIIINKSYAMKPIEDKIQNLFQKLIDQLSNVRDKILSQTRQKSKNVFFTGEQLCFLRKLQQKDSRNITCDFIWKIHQNLFEKNVGKISIEAINGKIQQYYKKILEQTKRFGSKVQKYLNKTLQTNYQSHFVGSKVIIDYIETNKMKKLLSKNLKSTQLLYRASQNDFLLAEFHKKCDGIRETVIICETQHGKKIGGFTPLGWESGQSKYLEDKEKESFIFSLTNEDKFKLIQSQYAIYLQKQAEGRPKFGRGCDLAIHNQADKSLKAWSYFNRSYFNDKYKYGNKQSFQRFSGSKDSGFYLKQWEVWKVKFQ